VAEPDLPEYVIAELRHESPLIFTRDRFAAVSARAAARADSLNATLARYDLRALRPHFGASPATLAARAAVAATLPPEPSPLRFRRRGLDAAFIQAGFVQIIPKRADDARRIARALGRNESVWRAAVAPRPVPAWAARPAPRHSFEPSQGYLYSAPNG